MNRFFFSYFSEKGYKKWYLNISIPFWVAENFHLKMIAVVVQSLSCVQLFATPWPVACQASLSFTVSWSWLRLMFIESMMPSNHLIFSCLLLPLPSILPSIRVFSSNWALCIPLAKYWSFSLAPDLPMNIQGDFL